ncbi:MAG: hypothetical protein ACP5VF_05910, partial [Acidobacteriota bacterium]
MARSRNLKPGFFTNDLLAEVPPLGRLLFAGLWTLADREGRLEDRPKRIKAQLFPYDDCDVDALLEELAKRRFIQRYEVDGLRLLQVTTWHRHQNPHIKEPESTLPAPGHHTAGPGPVSGETGPSPSGPPAPDEPVPCQHGTSLVPAPDPNQTRPGRAPEETGSSTGPAPVSHGSGPADSGFLIPDSLIPDSLSPDSLSPNPDSLILDSPSPNPESAAERIPSSGIPQTSGEPVRPQGDSDKRTRAKAEDSEMLPLRAIAQRVELKLSPSEVAGYIMAHFPMQRRDRHQRASPGDSGLTLEQVHCLAKHGCTLQNARKAFEHFQQEPHPKNPGAWAFHCLREELSQDGRLELREETRSAQRAFRERSAKHLKGEAEPDGTGESRPAGAA